MEYEDLIDEFEIDEMEEEEVTPLWEPRPSPSHHRHNRLQSRLAFKKARRRAERKAKHYGIDEEDFPYWVARNTRDRTPCSCPMCGNKRRWFGEKTMQEKRIEEFEVVDDEEVEGIIMGNDSIDEFDEYDEYDDWMFPLTNAEIGEMLESNRGRIGELVDHILWPFEVEDREMSELCEELQKIVLKIRELLSME